MRACDLFIVSFISMIGLTPIKADWVEIPQFSHNKKIYRASLQLDRLYQFSRDKSRTEFSTRPTVQRDSQIVTKLKNLSEIRKTSYQKGPGYLVMNDATTSLSFDSSAESSEEIVTTAATATVTVLSENKNLDENKESFQDYYYDEHDAEEDLNDKQITTPFTSEKDELYTTCPTDVLQTKVLSNVSTHHHHSGKQNLNGSKAENDEHFLYYLPIKLLRRVHLILKAQPATLKGKIIFLKNFEKALLSEVESRLASTISPITETSANTRNRKRRYDHHEDDTLGFPSLEGALMAISFLTFAVYLVRLIMMLFQNFVNPTTATVYLGRKKRSMDLLNEDTVRILGYLNK